MMTEKLHIIGGGMAGCEAAWQAANAGVEVVIHEMRPHRKTDAHKTEGLAELVCSNSFRSDDATGNAVGVLHAEMRMLSSIILTVVMKRRCLRVARLLLTVICSRLRWKSVSTAIRSSPLCGKKSPAAAGRMAACDYCHGPLTSSGLGDAIADLTGEDDLAFFDAIAPIIHFETINLDIAWFQSRYDKSTDGGDGKDYINCPMDEAQYDAFIAAMLAAEKMDFREWEANTYLKAVCPSR